MTALRAAQKCIYCNKISYFLIKIIDTETASFMLTQCPECKRYEDVREVVSKNILSGEQL